MSKTDFSWVNACDTATFTAGSEAATLPASNLANSKTGKVWRSLATTSYFIANFAAATNITVLALGSCTLSSTDTVRHRLYSGANATGTLLYDSGVVSCGVLDGYALHISKLAATYSALSWRCDIVATSRATAAYGYFDIKRAWAAPILQTGVGMSHGWGEVWKDGSDNVRGKLSGGFFGGDGPKQRLMNFTLDWLSESEKTTLLDMQRLIGTKSQLLFIPDEDLSQPRTAILGRLLDPQEAKESAARVPPVYSMSFSILQDL